MPALPAFFRYLSERRSASKSRGEGWKTGFGSSTFINRDPRSTRRGANVAPLPIKEYEELDDLERGQKYPINSEGTTTTIEGGCSKPSISEEMVEDLKSSVHTNAFVLTSVQIESHPQR